MAEEKVIADIEAQFENRKHNLAFDIQDGTAYIYLVADGMQVAEIAKLLLLKGKSKTFGVKFYERNSSNTSQREGPVIER